MQCIFDIFLFKVNRELFLNLYKADAWELSILYKADAFLPRNASSLSIAIQFSFSSTIVPNTLIMPLTNFMIIVEVVCEQLKEALKTVLDWKLGRFSRSVHSLFYFVASLFFGLKFERKKKIHHGYGFQNQSSWEIGEAVDYNSVNTCYKHWWVSLMLLEACIHVIISWYLDPQKCFWHFASWKQKQNSS